jgi:hypothetical protein
MGTSYHLLFTRKVYRLLPILLLPGAACTVQEAYQPNNTEYTKQVRKLDSNSVSVFYPIMAWNYETHDKKLFRGMAESNFNTVGFIMPSNLPAVEEAGLKAIIIPEGGSIYGPMHWPGFSDEKMDRKVKEMIGSTADNESVLGYFLMDEPPVTAFKYLAEEVKSVKKYAPGKLAYINLCHNYATTSQLGTESYTDYLKKYVKVVHPQFLSYDNYMIQYSANLKNKERTLKYFKNLLSIRKIALKNGLPYWNTIPSMQLRKRISPPTLANMMLQVYTSLAAGYDGISWFTYSPNWDYSYNVHSPVDGLMHKTKTWHAIKEVNRQVLALAPVINRLTSTGVYFTSSMSIKSLPKLPGKNIKSVQSSQPLMVGEFVDDRGNAYAMFVNLSLERSAEFTFSTQSAINEAWHIIDGRRKNTRAKKKNILKAKNGTHYEGKKIVLKAGAGKLIEIK